MSGRKILIVEDERLTVMQLFAFLRELDYEVVGNAEDGASALAKMKTLEPDLVLMDILLKGELDGIDTALRIKEDRAVPVVFLTAVSDDETIRRAQVVDPYGFVIKPFSSAILHAAITTALHRWELEQARARMMSELLAREEGLKSRNEEMKRVQERLSETQARYFELFDLAPLGYLTLDDENTIVEANLAFSTLIGMVRKDLIRRCFTSFIEPEDRNTLLKHQEELLEGGTSGAIEVRIAPIDAAPRWVKLEMSVVRDAAGSPAYKIAMSDIDERKKVNTALRESESRFKSVVNNINEYVYAMEYRDGEPVHHYYSPKCRRITGYESAELDADPHLWLDMIHAEDRRKVLEYLEEIKAGKTPQPIEHRIVRKDGTTTWVMNSCTAERGEDGNLRRTEGFILDMDERIRMEHEIIEARNVAESANRAKSDFLASMSHELRTPLNSILGFSQLLAMEESGSLNDRQKAYIGDIKASGDHLLSMISDILDLSKIEAGKIEILKKPFDLRSMLVKLAETMGSLAEKKRIGIVTDIAPDIGLLDADEVRVRQVFYNLLSNAIKFTGEGRTVELDARGEENRAVMTIRDEGIGIAEEDQKRIFAPFEQVRQAAAYQGTGLGLAITERLVQLHGGLIELESAPGKGSRFTVVFPGRTPERRSMPSPVVAKKEASEPKAGAAGILVVEDNPVNRKLMMAMLESIGYAATFAATGEEAVEIAGSRPFDLIFMDVNLPGMDGIEAMKRIRQGHVANLGCGRRAGDSPTAIVALTAHAMKGDMERFIAEGMDDVITKPIELERFRSVLGKYLSGLAESALRASVPGTGAVGGIDEKRGLLLLGGNRDLFAEMLGIFATTYASFPRELRSALGRATSLEARRIVHGLKGASSNLGLREVETVAGSLESKIASGEIVSADDPSVESLAGVLETALETIRNYG
jgi:PAS domain S-box-containing protein